MTQHHKILLKVASVITSPDELNTLGIYLERDYNYIGRLKKENPNLKDAAYNILCSFYGSIPDDKRWLMLLKALKQLDKNTLVTELKLEELHKKAQSSFSASTGTVNEFTKFHNSDDT